LLVFAHSYFFTPYFCYALNTIAASGMIRKNFKSKFFMRSCFKLPTWEIEALAILKKGDIDYFSPGFIGFNTCQRLENDSHF
ncbi:MAG: hypothetical protein ACE5FF_15595, partial [Saprospiraceae bacterium]